MAFDDNVKAAGHQWQHNYLAVAQQHEQYTKCLSLFIVLYHFECVSVHITENTAIPSCIFSSSQNHARRCCNTKISSDRKDRRSTTV